ncbi:unnamed protein product, partial [Musa textilis]
MDKLLSDRWVSNSSAINERIPQKKTLTDPFHGFHLPTLWFQDNEKDPNKAKLH